MSRTIGIPDSAETVEVDLFGTIYTTVPLTRSREIAVEEIRQQVEKLKPDDFETVDAANKAAATLFCKQADEFLRPPEGKRKKASALLLTAYLEDKMTFRQLEQLLQDIAEAVADRPT